MLSHIFLSIFRYTVIWTYYISLLEALCVSLKFNEIRLISLLFTLINEMFEMLSLLLLPKPRSVI